MEILRDLARSGRTIVSTIHQPNSDIFEMFDRLMLLAQGKIIYFNEAKHAVGHFDKIGYKCPELSNPADYFMSIMSIESQEVEDNEDAQARQRSQVELQKVYTERIDYFHSEYLKSELVNDYKYVCSETTPLSDQDRQDTQTSWCYQLGLLLKRNFLNIIRLPQTSYVKLLVTVVTAIFTIILFSNIDGTPQGI